MLNELWELGAGMMGRGTEADELGPVQVLIRVIVVYGATLALVKIGSRRFLGRASLFDAVVAIMLGSIMSRGVVSGTPILQTIMAGLALIGLHWLLATVALRFSIVGPMVKGNPVLLIKDGEVQKEGMRRARISMNDLEEALRLEAKHEDPSRIRAAYLERNGKISVIPGPSEPRILEASLEGGTQTVRIRLE